MPALYLPALWGVFEAPAGSEVQSFGLRLQSQASAKRCPGPQLVLGSPSGFLIPSVTLPETLEIEGAIQSSGRRWPWLLCWEPSGNLHALFISNG